MQIHITFVRGFVVLVAYPGLLGHRTDPSELEDEVEWSTQPAFQGETGHPPGISPWHGILFAHSHQKRAQ